MVSQYIQDYHKAKPRSYLLCTMYGILLSALCSCDKCLTTSTLCDLESDHFVLLYCIRSQAEKKKFAFSVTLFDEPTLKIFKKLHKTRIFFSPPNTFLESERVLSCIFKIFSYLRKGIEAPLTPALAPGAAAIRENTVIIFCHDCVRSALPMVFDFIKDTHPKVFSTNA